MNSPRVANDHFRNSSIWSRFGLISICFSILIASAGCRRTKQPLVEDTVAKETATRTVPASFITRDVPILQSCTFSNGREAQLCSILEIVGGGVGCVDYDSDGRADLFFPRGGQIDGSAQRVYGKNSRILQGVGNWQFVDRTAIAGIDSSEIYSHGITSADFDQDGFADLLVYGYEGVKLFHNLGDGTFQDLTRAAGLVEIPWTTAATWLDVDADNDLDLYLGSYVDWGFATHQICPARNGENDVCSPNAFDGMRNSLFVNEGRMRFEPNAKLLDPNQPAKTLGVLAAEFDPDGGTSLYVANDLLPNFLFTPTDNRYEERGFAAGVAADDSGIVNGSMGVTLLDFNLDQRFDIFVTNFEHELMGLYLNSGAESFRHASRQAGLNRPELQIVGFGVVAGDFDSDGDEDVVFTGGHVHYFPDNGSMLQLPVYLANEQGRKFTEVRPDSEFFKTASVGRGLATADFDDDGDLDLIQTSLFDAPVIIENQSSRADDWLTVELIGRNCARTPIGATVELSIGQVRMVRQLHGGGSYLSQSQQRLHFAWPAEVDDGNYVRLKVRWPDGSTHTASGIAPGQIFTLVQ